MEFQAVSGGLITDPAQHLEILVAFCIRKLHCAHVVSRNGKQEGIGKVEVSVGDHVRVIVANAEAQREAVESLGGEHGEIRRPHRMIVVPGLVLDITQKASVHRAHRIGGLFYDGLTYFKSVEGIVGIIYPIRKFEHRIDKAAGVRSATQK